MRMKTNSRRAQKFAAILGATDSLPSRRIETRQVGQLPSTCTEVQIYAASDARVAQWLSTLFGEKMFFSLFLRESTFLKSILFKRKTAVRTILLQCVPTTMKAFLHFHDTVYVESSNREYLLHEKLHRKTGSPIRAAGHLVKKVRSALSRFIDLRNLPLAYGSYFI